MILNTVKSEIDAMLLRLSNLSCGYLFVTAKCKKLTRVQESNVTKLIF